MRPRRWLVRLVALAAVLSGACDGTGNSKAGDLLVAYTRNGPEAGAVLITIAGGPIESVSALGGQQVSFASPLTGTTHVVIAGTLVTGDLLRIRVPDVTLFAGYTVTTDQVADKTTFALLQTSEHTFTVHR